MPQSNIMLLLEVTGFKGSLKEWRAETVFKFMSSETMSHNTITFWTLKKHPFIVVELDITNCSLPVLCTRIQEEF